MTARSSRLFIFLMIFVFAAVACSPETGSENPPATENNQNEDVETGEIESDDTGTIDIDVDPDDTNPPLDTCYSVSETGTCLANSALWCDDKRVRALLCADTGASGCHSGVCTGIPRGYECDARRECASDLICRRNKCTDANPGGIIARAIGDGRVSSSTLDIDCTDQCLAFGPGFMEVSLSAEPAEGSIFLNWSHDCSGESPTTRVTLASNITKICRAHFERTDAKIHVVVPEHGGRVQSEPAGIDCPDGCTALFDLGQSVTLTAVPDPGFIFESWSDCSDSRDASITFPARSAYKCIAKFQKQIELDVEITGPGRVTSPQAGIDCPGTCRSIILPGKVYAITAIPDPGARFVQWEGNCTSSHTAITIEVIDSNQRPLPDQVRCNAVFEEIPRYPLNISVVGKGRVTGNPPTIDCPDLSCSASYAEGTLVYLNARSSPDSQFIGWSSPSPDDTAAGCTGLGAISLRMQQARSCQATFTNKISATRTWQHATIPPHATHVQWNPDGTQFAVANGEILRRFNAQTGHFLEHWAEQFATDLPPGPIAWSPDGSFIAFGGAFDSHNDIRFHRIYLLRPDQPSGLWINTPAPIHHITVNPTGTIIAGTATNGSVSLWNTSNRKLISSWDAHNSPITALTWSPDGLFLATSSAQENTRVWSTATWTLEHEFTGPGWNSLDWNHDATRLSGATHTHLHVWSLDGTERTSWPATNCKSVSFNPTATKVVATCDSKLTIWDIATQTLSYTAPTVGTTLVRSTRWNPTQDKILALYDDHSIRILDSENGEVIATHHNGTDAAINGLVYSPFTNQLYAANADGFVYSVEPTRGAHVTDFNIPQLPGSIPSIALSPTGDTLIAAQDSYIYEWSTLTGVSTLPRWNAGASVTHIGLSHDDILATSLAASPDIHLWPTRGQPHTTTIANTHAAAHIAWKPGTNLLASTSKTGVNVWDTQTKTLQTSRYCDVPETAHGVSFSTDGRYLTTLCSHSSYFYDMNNDSKLLIVLDTAITLAAWRPDTHTIATVHSSNQGNVIQIYHITRTPLFDSPKPIPGTVSSLTWSIDGTQLFVGSSDGIITAFAVTP